MAARFLQAARLLHGCMVFARLHDFCTAARLTTKPLRTCVLCYYSEVNINNSNKMKTLSYNRSATALALAVLLLLAARPTDAGPLTGMASYAACQTGCNIALAACYGAAGLVVGTLTLGMGAPAAAVACSAQQAACMAACAVMAGLTGVSPTP